MTRPMRLVLIRHGEAHAGFHGPIAGPKGCAGLTPLGRRQAEALRDHLATSGRLRADLLVSSVLPRAIETAAIIAPGLGLELAEPDCDLCEIHTGDADGVDWADYNASHGSFDMEAEPDRVFASGGDSWNSFHRRVGGVVERFARERPDSTVAAVCHAGVIMATMRLLLGITDPATSAHLRPSNTGLTEWEHEQASGRWFLRSYNEAVHLIDLEASAARPGDDPFSRTGAAAEA
jgi:probable phosphoglycerate mutase